MYNVMIVDDDYPVLEFLSEEVDWEVLGLHLQSIHENGASALECALTEMPDILVTDIGMPKMNGLELTEKLKKKNPQLQVAILSCHNEFKYAQKAISLNVQDYILKETLDPKDFSNILLTYKKRLENEATKTHKQNRLLNEIKKNKYLAKEKFLRQVIYQSDYNQIWLYDENQSSFKLDRIPYTPVLCLVDNYVYIKEYFHTEDTLRFAMQNVIDDVISENKVQILHFNFEYNQSFILFPNQKSCNYQEIKATIKQIQNSLYKYLNISTSYIIGDSIKPKNLQLGLKGLTEAVGQRFYRETYSITQNKCNKIKLNSEEDLFSYYDNATIEFRKAIFSDQEEVIDLTVKKWINFIREKSFQPKIVKEWILKLLLGLKVKMKSMQYFESNYNLEVLHHEILLIDSIEELKEWLVKKLKSVQLMLIDAKFKTKHREILNACIYISMNLESKLTLEEVADHIYLNPSYFSRLFRREIGITFIEYVTSLKMDRAKELLDQTSYTVSEISERLGYDNQSYFIKLFKNYIGKTPIEYRESK